MEAINDAAKLLAQSIVILKEFKVSPEEYERSNKNVIELLKTALDKLVVEI